MERQKDIGPLVLFFLAALRDDIKIERTFIDEDTGEQIIEVAVARFGDETFVFDSDELGRFEWSVTRAAEIIRRDEVIARMVDTRAAAAMVATKMIMIEREKLAQMTPTSLARPIIIVPMSDGTGCLIDGWHRVTFAACHGLFELPAYLLTSAQELECRIIGDGIDRTIPPRSEGGGSDASR